MLSPAPGQGPGGGGGWSGRGGGGGAVTPGSCRGHGAHVGAGGVVAVLRSNMRCSYYELVPERWVDARVGMGYGYGDAGGWELGLWWGVESKGCVA